MTFQKKNRNDPKFTRKKRLESWNFSFSLKTCVTKGKCVTQGMPKMYHSGYVYCNTIWRLRLYDLTQEIKTRRINIFSLVWNSKWNVLSAIVLSILKLKPEIEWKLYRKSLAHCNLIYSSWDYMISSLRHRKNNSINCK